MPDVRLQPNNPVTLSLSDPSGVPEYLPSGVPEDWRVHYALEDGRTLTLFWKNAVALNELDLRPGESFCICRDVQEVRGIPQSHFRVWLSPETEKRRAAEETAPDLTEALEASIQIVKARKRKPVQTEDQPRLFDQRGTGTYGPLPAVATQPAQGRAESRIPMNVAFSEVVRFVTQTLKESGEQWSDQSRQDFISTAFIAAQKLGLLKVWER